MPRKQPPPSDVDLGALSFRALRRCIGIVALGLPPVLIVGRAALDGTSGDWPGSISAYYYTSVRNVFVGALCALAVFLFCYRYRPQDNVLSTVAAVLALGVALLPTANPGGTSAGEEWVRVAHLGSAAGFFLILASFSLFIFTKHGGALTAQKIQRNRVYRTCGVLILAFLGLAVANGVLDAKVDGYRLQDYNALFYLESGAVWAFAVSWLVKGGFMLADPEPAQPGD